MKTIEEKTILLAGKVGFKRETSATWYKDGLRFVASRGYGRLLPPYFHSLDAVAELEKMLNPIRVSKAGTYPPESEVWWKYVQILLRICESRGHAAMHATAADRADAIGVTLELWTLEECEK